MGTRYEYITKKRTGHWKIVRPDSTSVSGSSDRTLSYLNSVVSGGPVPNWKRKIANGEDATTPLTGVRYTARKYKSIVSMKEYDNGRVESIVGYGTSGLVPSFPGVLYNPTVKAASEAETNFAKSYRKATRQMQGGVFLAEIAETANLLRNPVRGMFELTHDFAKALRKGRRLGFSRYRTFLSDAWLTYSFGMKPLASDANDYATALRALSSGRNFELIRLFGTGSSETQEVSSDYQSSSVTGGGASWVQRYDQVRRCEVTIRGAVKIRGEIPPAQIFGLSKLDIIPTVWEAIPFSFLVDYFTNIGDTLDASMLRFVDFAWLNQTVRNSRDRTYSSAKPLAPSLGIKRTWAYGGEAVFATKSVSRGSRDNNFGGPVTFTAPGLGSMKWLNISALASSIFASKPIGGRF